MAFNYEMFKKFQSHNGAIAAKSPVGMVLWAAQFQSHNGAIAAPRTPAQFDSAARFNPTMVRLLPLRY